MLIVRRMIMKKKIQKTNAMRVLEKHKIDYTVHEYPWNDEHTDAQSAADKISMPLHKIYKTLVVSPSSALSSEITPASSLTISTFTLSVSSSRTFSPFSTESPTCLNQVEIVPSV